MENMKYEKNADTLLNDYRRNYHESKAFINAANKGQIKINKGYWLNQCKKDKAALKAYADRLKSEFNKRKG
tara:strand:- start:846 stop:1058 length:213 start_codon:yes stop_codon:yes gene_type:complete